MSKLRFKTKDENIHWVDTGRVNIGEHVITRVYNELSHNSDTIKEVDGDLIIINTLSPELIALVNIMRESNNILTCLLPREKYLTKI